MIFFSGILGLVIGSFLNVCIYRLPRKISLAAPRSYCPACGTTVAWYDLVPLFSYLWLRGRCRNCGKAISWRYPVVELITAGLYMAVYHRFGLTIEYLTGLALISLMVVVTFIDIEFRIIPNRLVAAGLAAGTAFAIFRPTAGLVFAGSGFLAGFGLLLAVAVLSRGQMGYGDVKLAGVMGVFLGWEGMVPAFFLAFAGGALYGIFLMAVLGWGRKTAVPFGPFLAAAAVATYFWGETITGWYLHTFLQ